MNNVFINHSIYIKYHNDEQSNIKKMVEIKSLSEFYSLWNENSDFKMYSIYDYLQKDGQHPIFIITHLPYNSKCLKVHINIPINNKEKINKIIFHIYYLYVQKLLFRTFVENDLIEKHFIGLELTGKKDQYSISFLLDGIHRADVYAILFNNIKQILPDDNIDNNINNN